MATGALAQSATELPPLEVETTKKVKKRPGSEPQVPVTQVSGAASDTDAPVVHSANNTPTDAAKVGSSVTVLTERDLDKQSKTFLKDYLQQVTGVNFSQNGPPGSTTRLSVRGAALKYVKVLIDGIDVSDPSGTETQTHFEHLLVGDVSRIEVLKGSQSTLYGGDAVAGVISIETKVATKPGFSQSGGAEYGSYSTYRGAYTAGFASQDGSNVALTVQGINTAGFSAASAGNEDDGYRNLTLSGRGEYFISPSVSVFFAARTYDAKNEFDGNVNPDPFGAVIFGDLANSGTSRQSAGRAGTRFSFLDGAFQNTLAIQGMRIERDFHDVTSAPTDSSYTGKRVKGEYKGVLSFNEHLALLVGADWERTSLANNSLPYQPEAEIIGSFAQLMIEPINGLLLTGGGRIDEHDAFGQFDTYRLTAAYLLPGTETKLRASASTGFRAPSLDELYGSYPQFFMPNYGNPNLTPEESESWDIGVDQGFMRGAYTVSATYFELDTLNLIGFNGDCFSDPTIPCLANVAGTTNRKGVELSSVAHFTESVAVSMGYTYVQTETPTNTRLPFVPRHSFVLGLDFQPIDKVELNVTGQYVADTFQSRTDQLDNYFLLSAKAAYEIVPGWKAYVRGENLLDEQYETIAQFGTAGLAVYGGVQMALPEN
ncbi:TonB-dependent receptor [Hyphomicrobium sp. xq]|uniref:TonB-dependent receptor n=2 Tax=Hyphomicrobium album TaxID=2665159 RepID=A0A6I3KHS4_9HYPH|nr:TonB-dependent receptor [Hyphomicrobium album]